MNENVIPVDAEPVISANEVAPVVETVIQPTVASEPQVTIAEPVVKRKRTPKAKKRGRPPVFIGAIKTGIVRLLKSQKNLTHVQQILSATKRQQDLVAMREKVGIDKRLTISLPTLGKFARAAKVEIAIGRPAA